METHYCLDARTSFAHLLHHSNVGYRETASEIPTPSTGTVLVSTHLGLAQGPCLDLSACARCRKAPKSGLTHKRLSDEGSSTAEEDEEADELDEEGTPGRGSSPSESPPRPPKEKDLSEAPSPPRGTESSDGAGLGCSGSGVPAATGVVGTSSQLESSVVGTDAWAAERGGCALVCRRAYSSLKMAARKAS